MSLGRIAPKDEGAGEGTGGGGGWGERERENGLLKRRRWRGITMRMRTRCQRCQNTTVRLRPPENPPFKVETVPRLGAPSGSASPLPARGRSCPGRTARILRGNLIPWTIGAALLSLIGRGEKGSIKQLHSRGTSARNDESLEYWKETSPLRRILTSVLTRREV